MVARGSRPKQPLPAEPTEPLPDEPIEPLPDEPEFEGEHAPPISPTTMLRAELCRHWEQEGDSPRWRTALNDVVLSDIHKQIEIIRPQWHSIPELERAAYNIARAAISQGCPQFPLPTSQKNAQDLSESGPPYWGELWNVYYTSSYTILSGLGT